MKLFDEYMDATSADRAGMCWEDQERTWRKAYESIRNQILNNSPCTSRAGIVAFIDEELDE